MRAFIRFQIMGKVSEYGPFLAYFGPLKGCVLKKSVVFFFERRFY